MLLSEIYLTEVSKKDILSGLDYHVDVRLKRLKEMIDIINHLIVDDEGDGQYNEKILQKCMDNWHSRANENIAFEEGVQDDLIPDYEADLLEVYDYMERQLKVLFKHRFRRPNLKKELAPNLTYDQALGYVQDYFLKNYRGEVFF